MEFPKIECLVVHAAVNLLQDCKGFFMATLHAEPTGTEGHPVGGNKHSNARDELYT